jgi:hypothetical protein
MMEDMRALIRVTAWERVSLSRRLLGALVRVGILIAFVTILFSLLAPPPGILIMVRMEANRRPAVRIAPIALADHSVSNSPGRTLSYFGYEFAVPWNVEFKERVLDKSALVQLKFESGQDLIFAVPVNQAGLLTEVAEDRSLKMGYLRLVFGDLMKRSAYEQYEALLNTTPQNIRAFGPRAEAARGVALLTIKAIAFGPRLESGIFTFALPDKHGFQIGDPQKSRRVDLEVFDSAGHHVEILCGSTNSSIRLSQSELNRILTSLHAVAKPAQFAAFQK